MFGRLSSSSGGWNSNCGVGWSECCRRQREEGQMMFGGSSAGEGSPLGCCSSGSSRTNLGPSGAWTTGYCWKTEPSGLET